MYTSLQEIFTKVATHLLTQKEKAGEFQSRKFPNKLYCLYRDESGRSCAIGCLIPDAEYKREFEGLSIMEIFSKRHILGPVTASLEPFMQELLQLQAIHDDEEISPSQWKDELEKFANSYELVMPRSENE